MDLRQGLGKGLGKVWAGSREEFGKGLRKGSGRVWGKVKWPKLLVLAICDTFLPILVPYKHQTTTKLFIL